MEGSEKEARGRRTRGERASRQGEVSGANLTDIFREGGMCHRMLLSHTDCRVLVLFYSRLVKQTQTVKAAQAEVKCCDSVLVPK
jgi:hypothetical protein